MFTSSYLIFFSAKVKICVCAWLQTSTVRPFSSSKIVSRHKFPWPSGLILVPKYSHFWFERDFSQESKITDFPTWPFLSHSRQRSRWRSSFSSLLKWKIWKWFESEHLWSLRPVVKLSFSEFLIWFFLFSNGKWNGGFWLFIYYLCNAAFGRMSCQFNNSIY